MNFDDQVRSITGLTISSSGTNPTETQLSQYLKDGVIDVTAKMITINPNSIRKFLVDSGYQTSNGLDVNGAVIAYVLREAGTAGDLRACTEVSIADSSRVTDKESLHYASAFNPVYAVDEDGAINVYPVADSSPNRYKVFYVNNVPQNKSGAALIYSHSNIKYFDDSRVYYVVLFAACKALNNALANIDISIPDSPIPPGDLITSTITISAPTHLGYPENYQHGQSGGGSGGGIAGTTSAVVPILKDDGTGSLTTSDGTDMISAWLNIGDDVAPPVYEKPEFNLGTTDVDEYNQQVEAETHRFNAAHKVYQEKMTAKKLYFESVARKGTTGASGGSGGGGRPASHMTGTTDQTLIKKADIDFQQEIQKGIQRIQKFQQEVQLYAGKVQAEVSKKQNEYTWMQARLADLTREYIGAFTTRDPEQRGEERRGRGRPRGT